MDNTQLHLNIATASAHEGFADEQRTGAAVLSNGGRVGTPSILRLPCYPKLGV